MTEYISAISVFEILFSYTVLSLGLISLTLSTYLWYFFSSSTQDIGNAVKLIYVGETIVAMTMIAAWLVVELTGPIKDPALSNAFRAIAFIANSICSFHMAYQISKV